MKNTAAKKQTLTKTQKDVIEYLKTCLAKQSTFDRFQDGSRKLNAVFSLMTSGILVSLSTSTCVHEQKKRMGHWETSYYTAFTVGLSNNFESLLAEKYS